MGDGLATSRQCELACIPRSSYYYKPRPESPLNHELMRIIDEQYMRTPFYGIPRMTAFLRSIGYRVNHKRVERLMSTMGIHAIYPKKGLSNPAPSHKVYPYLLKNLNVFYPDQVWCSDITYIRMRRGYVYLTVIMDWYSRYVLSWRLSITLSAQFCIEALNMALLIGRPKIFNSDQGSQYTSNDFTSLLLSRNILISMDGRGRVFDNIFIERLWRTLKYDEVYLKDYADVWDAEENIGKYFEFYNTERYHSALGFKTPAEVYFKRRRTTMPNEQEEIKLNNGSFLY